MSSKATYAIEKLDIDGDGFPDGDLVTKYVNGKIVARKFVPLKKMKTIAKKVVKNSEMTSTKKIKLYSRNKIQKSASQASEGVKTDKVVVQNESSFGQYVKMGAGLEVGKLGVDALADGLGNLFSGDDE
jgi:hypothetical protein